MKLTCITLLVALLLCSCAIMPKDDRITRSSDLPNRFSPTVLTATRNFKVGSDFLKLRENKTFVYRTEVMGLRTCYYSGTYTFEDRILKLKFDYGRTPGNLDTILVLTAKDGDPAFEGANDKLYIATRDPYEITLPSSFHGLVGR